MKPCWNCGTHLATPGRHVAPCGAVCQAGCALNVPEGEKLHLEEKELHIRPWEGPPETDGHYHGECPKGCFTNCCTPKGNHCGPTCQHCFPKEDGKEDPGDMLFACCVGYADGQEHDVHCRRNP